MDVIVTDLTNMSRGNHCVAGYDPTSLRMIRPKPNGRNWTSDQIDTYKIEVGRVLNLGTRAHQQLQSHLPHRNEDWFVYADEMKPGNKAMPQPNSSDSLQGCFGNNVVQGRGYRYYFKAYVEDGVNCCSLAGLNQNTKNLYLFFTEFDGKRKLRAKFIDSAGEGWDLGVTSTELNNQIQDKENLKAYNRQLGEREHIHLRVGLARRFPAQHNRCFVQLNGIIL